MCVKNCHVGDFLNLPFFQDYVIVKQNDVKIDGDIIDLAVECVFLVMWRGVAGSSAQAWIVSCFE